MQVLLSSDQLFLLVLGLVFMIRSSILMQGFTEILMRDLVILSLVELEVSADLEVLVELAASEPSATTIAHQPGEEVLPIIRLKTQPFLQGPPIQVLAQAEPV